MNTFTTYPYNLAEAIIKHNPDLAKYREWDVLTIGEKIDDYMQNSGNIDYDLLRLVFARYFYNEEVKDRKDRLPRNNDRPRLSTPHSLQGIAGKVLRGFLIFA